ncbi:hypothetical protein Mapa_013237 [Marchantia paleacea]|nr:hypothetical protein Mapa_013237 [Marchantia paleacea]
MEAMDFCCCLPGTLPCCPPSKALDHSKVVDLRRDCGLPSSFVFLLFENLCRLDGKSFDL